MWRQKPILCGGTESGILRGADMRLHQRACRAGQGRPQAAPQGSPLPARQARYHFRHAEITCLPLARSCPVGETCRYSV